MSCGSLGHHGEVEGVPGVLQVAIGQCVGGHSGVSMCHWGLLWAPMGHYRVYMGLCGGSVGCCRVSIGCRTSLWDVCRVYGTLRSVHEFLWVAMGHLKKKPTKNHHHQKKLLKRTTKEINLKNKNEGTANKAD